MLLTQMVIIVTIMETGIIRTQMETTLLVLKLSMDKSYFSATMVNRSKGAYGNSYGDLYAFYDVNSGNLVTNRYIDFMGNWFYVGKDGKPVKGARNIDGQDVFFNYRGVQAKGDFGQDGVYMPEYYYDKDNGRKVTKAGFVKDNRGLTYYLDEKGNKVLGLHEINGDLYYFRRGGAYKYTQLGVTCGKTVLITSMVRSTTSVNLVRLPKIVSIFTEGSLLALFLRGWFSSYRCRSN